jgi:hypothetical protein
MKRLALILSLLSPAQALGLDGIPEYPPGWDAQRRSDAKFFRLMNKAVRPENFQALLDRSPGSQNIEDRRSYRGQGLIDFAPPPPMTTHSPIPYLGYR